MESQLHSTCELWRRHLLLKFLEARSLYEQLKAEGKRKPWIPQEKDFSILSQPREFEGRSRVPAAPLAESLMWKRQEDESQDDGPAATCQAGTQVRPVRSLPSSSSNLQHHGN